MKGDRRYRAFASRVVAWERAHPRDFPWRRNRTPYRVFVSEFLLKRTTSTAVKRVYPGFLEQFPSLIELNDAPVGEVEEALRPVGLYRQRAKGVKETARCLITNFGGEFPRTWEELMGVPHIGDYTAGCVLSFGHGIRAPAVDSNVERVLKRCFADVLGEDPSHREFLDLSWTIVPLRDHALYNYGVIDLGALVCSYRGCKKDVCPVTKLCAGCRAPQP